MDCELNGKTYRYVPNAWTSGIAERNAYFSLAQRVFHLNFQPWLDSGYSNGDFSPYTLYDGDTAVSSVGVAVSRFCRRGNRRTYAQLSTVMTLPEYRGLGLNRWLMARVLEEWLVPGKCDGIYLHANDMVLDFYPQFGFVPVHEYDYTAPLRQKAGNCRRLDMANPADVQLLVEKYKACNNPFSALPIVEGVPQLLFHCTTFLQAHIYYVQNYDAVVIAQNEEETLLCYDIYMPGMPGGSGTPADILGIIATESTTQMRLGFPPIAAHAYNCTRITGPDTAVFTLASHPADMFADSIIVPLLSQA